MSAPSPIPILLYHSLTREASARYRPYAIDPARFAEQMESLAASGCSTLTIRQLVDALRDPTTPLPARPVVITFDDGFREIYDVALPILQRLGLRGTALVVTGHVGGTSRWLDGDGEGWRPLMSWSQIRELAAHGIEIGSHSHRHPQLDTLSEASARTEIATSKQLIEDGIGQAVEAFAYPHGYHSRTVKRLVREAGYEVAFGVKHALSHRDDDRWGLGRAVVTADVATQTLQGWLAGEGLRRSWAAERPQTTVWRAVRRFRAGRAGSADPSTVDAPASRR
jgi:peptidoglycan/xylan/chitin deacetylase (PgdA/CDA1 family)